MADELQLAGDREPLGLWVRASRVAERPELRIEDLEFSSRGDRVCGRVMLPPSGAGPFPLVVLQDGSGGVERERALEAIGAAWAERGAAVASIDLPLQGARGDAKLLHCLPAPGDARSAPVRAALALERTRQAVIDLERALDALATRDWIDEERVAFVGFGEGARIGSVFCALEPRVRAAVLDAGADRPGPDLDPGAYLERIAPRPLLRVAQADRPGGSGREPQAIWDFLARAFDL